MDSLFDAAEGGDTNTQEQVVVDATRQLPVQPMEQKKVVKTADSKPVFKPVIIPYKKDTEPAPDQPKSRPRVVKNDK